MNTIGAIYLVKDSLLPPAGNLLLLAVAWLCRRRVRVSRVLVRLAIGSLVLCMVPLVAALIARPLERSHAFDPAAGAQGATAIVILGGGKYSAAPEWAGHDTVHQRTLERLRYGAYLQGQTQLPVALVGGVVDGGGPPEAFVMSQVMRESLNTPVQWLEMKSRNTAENASDARALIPANKIVLVTQALHMPRAQKMFEQAGFEVIPAPCGFTTGPTLDWVDPFLYLPSAEALLQSRAALHEYLGLWWYRLRYRA